MLKSAYLLAKIGADTAENEQTFAEIAPDCGRESEYTEEERSDLPVLSCSATA